MKRLLLETSLSKMYILVVGLISLLIMGGYFSYAMFTVSKEKDNAISIITGNLTYELLVDGKQGFQITIPSGETVTHTITLTNTSSVPAKFILYYSDSSIYDGVTVGYVNENGYSIPPDKNGVILSAVGTAGSSQTYRIKISGNQSSDRRILGLSVQSGLDYNELTLPSSGHTFDEYPNYAADILLADQGGNGSTYDDGVDTFITGTDPNNYIWYSGKLWRAVSVNDQAKTTKLVTQWNISAITYNASRNTAFAESYMEDWLNDTTVDGFLGNLRDPDKFIVKDSVWDATEDNTELGSITRPNKTTTVTDAVGLLNMYEYQSSYHGTTYSNGYLNNGIRWFTLTPSSVSSGTIRYVNDRGGASSTYPFTPFGGARPSINLKSSVKIVDGDGTIDNPYRLEGDNDTNLSGTLLNTRYSGEYIRFGNDENNLYRIVSHENGAGTKIVSEKPLKSSGTFITSAFGSSSSEVNYSTDNVIGTFLNGEYLTSYVDSAYSKMIEDNTTWYLGTVASSRSYKLAKYTDTTGATLTSSTTTAKVGLLRLGELMAGQFDRSANNASYWLLTPYSTSNVYSVIKYGSTGNPSPDVADEYGVRPSLNLKSNVKITSGTGTKTDPFTLSI